MRTRTVILIIIVAVVMTAALSVVGTLAVMTVFNKSVIQYLPSVAVGLGVALVAPILVVAAVSLMRPLAKAAIKGGFIVKDTALGACSLAGSQVEKLTGPVEAEVKAAPKARTKASQPAEKSGPEPTGASKT